MIFIDKGRVHQLPDFFCSLCRHNTEKTVQGLYRCNVMSRWTNPANLLCERGHLLGRPAFAEFLKPLEVGNLEKGTINQTVRIKANFDLPMPFQPGNRIYDNSAGHDFALFPCPRSNGVHCTGKKVRRDPESNRWPT